MNDNDAPEDFEDSQKPESREPGEFQPPKKNPADKIRNLVLRVFSSLKTLVEKIASGKSGAEAPAAPGNVTGKLKPAIDKALTALETKLPGKLKPYTKLIAGGLVLLVLIFGFKSCFHKKKASSEKLTDVVAKEKTADEGPVPVKGFKIGRFNFEDSLNALGTIKGSVEFKLSFEVPGAISSINYREGERYEEGALLISLRQDDILLRLKKSQADLNKFQTQAAIADKKVKEHEKLFAMGAIPKTTLENVKLELESAQYEAEAARLEVKAAESMLEKSNLYAPSAGMIGELNVEEGEAVTANTLLGTHISTEFVYAEFGIVERDVNKIALGQKARVFIDAYPDKTFEGVIENISPVVAGTSRTATAKVRIENPERLLLPGMFARIRILLYSKKNTLVVPTDSIQGSQGEQFIYVVHLNEPPAGEAKGETPVIGPEGENEGDKKPGTPAPAAKKPEKESGKKEKKEKGAKEEAPEEKAPEKNIGTAEKRPITVGYTRPDYSQIDAGISEGEVVAISSLEKLGDGKKVRLLETQEAEV